jgi:acyl carrier protein
MSRSQQEIQDWLVGRVGAMVGVQPAEVNPSVPLRRFGLDSVALVHVALDLEEWLGYRFRGNPLHDHPTIESLAHYLAEQSARDK